MTMVEDLVQEFWIKIWEEPSKIQISEDGTIKSYLLKVFTGYQLNYIRKESIRQQKTERFESKEDLNFTENGVLNKFNRVTGTDKFPKQYELEELIN